MVEIKYAQPALFDLKSIYEYISLDSKLRAKHFIVELRESVKTLKKYPDYGRVIYPEKFNNIRQLLYKSYPIVYQYSHPVIYILTIHHQSRLIENIPILKGYEK
jgi:toxin ParE1/3/4